MNPTTQYLGWGGMLRVALVQTALGAIVVLVTSTLNRVMIVELALPALVPAALVATHYLVQLLRVHHGYRVDVGGRATPRILGGMCTLALGGVAAALATAWMRSNTAAGILLAMAAYVAIGVGVGAAGTANLALLSKRVAPERRALAAALVWIMMIAGFTTSAGIAGHFLQPFSVLRLLQVYAVACALALALAMLAIRGIEPPRASSARAQDAAPASGAGFRGALVQLWQDPLARQFTLFLFMSMLAFSAQELLLEPYAGLVFGFSPGGSARLAGMQNGGVLIGMIALVIAALVGMRRARARQQPSAGLARRWMIAGTLGSAAGVMLLVAIGVTGVQAALPPAVVLLGIANGVFAVAALGVMMELSAAGGRGREGLRMGLWGAAQALAFAAGGLCSGAAVDLLRHLLGSAASAYLVVFGIDAALFVAAAGCVMRGSPHRARAFTAAPALSGKQGAGA